MKKLSLYAFLLLTTSLFSQEQLTLESCYQLVKVNYPLAKQNALFEKQNSIDKAIVSTEKLPQFNFNAQATYQSDVTKVPIPNSPVEALDKDQYKATISANQLIYGDGIVNASLDAKTAALNTQLKQVEVNLYQLKKSVNQLYFSILLVQEKRNLVTAKNNQLLAKLKEVKSGIKNGVLLPSSDKVLEAELLKVNQQLLELNFTKNKLIHSLSKLTGKEISSTTQLSTPELSTNLQTEIIRPEIELFQLKKEEIKASELLINKQNSPKIVGFATGGYGYPGLNMLDNSFKTFYTVGVKLNWNVFDWDATKKKRESLAINKDIVDTEASVFDLNTNIQLNEYQNDIEKLSQFITSDLEIIALRKEVLKAAESQLRNGVITSSAYITELTNLYEDESNLSTHTIEKLLAIANYNITKGE